MVSAYIIAYCSSGFDFSDITNWRRDNLRFLRAPHIVQVFDFSFEDDREDDGEEEGDEEGDEGNSPLPPSSKRSKTEQGKFERTETERTQAEVRKETRATRAGQKAASIARKAGIADHPQVDDGGYMMPEKPGVSPGTGMFHFDIDPQNGRLHLTKGKVASTHPQFEIMTDRHDRTPILKLIDFGLAQEMKVGDLDRMTTENLWLGRKNGKTGYFLPEQFTREWEAVVDPPDAQNARVAGQYSWKSNLWQFGMVSPVLRAHLPCPSRSDDLVASTSINRRPCT
ncbi:hypothetical protein SMACR_08761 [Sordaria macrospora]|uniref:Protein kinase domain-containing protein n=1 Tax=Sordaria macrospora TaxID=5147 RepID=A0A8S8ZLL8_SORMA|nr:hypothetical protein SMACR_08761 [Sordaria macrospora]WPJ67263.1 hypothetical protein SMAC4_08761 [Sordaria macrospora]